MVNKNIQQNKQISAVANYYQLSFRRLIFAL